MTDEKIIEKKKPMQQQKIKERRQNVSLLTDLENVKKVKQNS